MNKIYMMIGLPGSGKSTIAEQHKEEWNAVIVSSDTIRKELYGDEENQSNNKLVFKIAEQMILQNLRSKDVIFDATNINYKRRRAFIERMKKDADAQVIAVFVATPIEVCLSRNDNRERKVPKKVIEDMYKNFYVPQYYEGFSDIQIIVNGVPEKSLAELEQQLHYVSQDNPHHSFTIGRHCQRAAQYVVSLFNKIQLTNNQCVALYLATLMHDYGKIFCKVFHNIHGEPTSIAHYFNHEKVSAYLSVIYLEYFNIETRLLVANLIQWHMLLYSNLSDKTVIKYKNMFGEDVWNMLNLLHEADKNAK